jgi:hypothetical protein
MDDMPIPLDLSPGSECMTRQEALQELRGHRSFYADSLLANRLGDDNRSWLFEIGVLERGGRDGMGDLLIKVRLSRLYRELKA